MPDDDAPEIPEPETAKTDAPISADDALIWLAAARPPAVLAVLRERDFAPLAARAFAGFQANPRGYANPLVRRRLAAEAIKDSNFADKLRALAEAPALLPPASVPAAVSKTDEKKSDDKSETLRAERDARKRERDEARSLLTASQNDLTRALGESKERTKERDEARADASKLAVKIERLERKMRQVEREPTAEKPAKKPKPERVIAANTEKKERGKSLAARRRSVCGSGEIRGCARPGRRRFASKRRRPGRPRAGCVGA